MKPFIFLLKNQVVFHIKLGDKNGYSKNQPTKAVLNFHNPSMQFSNLQNVSKREIVYILNDIETEISDIRIINRNNKLITHSYSLLKMQTVFEQHDMDISPEEFKTSSSTSIVKVKKGILPDQNKQIQDKNE